MFIWSDPKPLTAYGLAERRTGIYIIGGAKNRSLPVDGSKEKCPYLQENWPENFTPYYVGISESQHRGIRGRLSSHCRSKGNKGIKIRIVAHEPLYFIAAYGDMADYEVLFLALKMDNQFTDNVRCEFDRAAKGVRKRVRAEMTESEQIFYDNLGYDGRGL